MPAQEAWFWNFIAPGATVGLYLHGYQYGDVAVFIADINAGPGDPTQFAINLTQGVVRKHYDSTTAREAWVHNIGLSSVAVTLYKLYDTAS
jgi:hypothetical protein